MIKTSDQKNNICMNEQYVLHFYQVKPTIKYYIYYLDLKLTIIVHKLAIKYIILI